MTLTEEQKLGIQARIDEYIKRYERPTYLDGILPSKSRNYYGASHYDKELDLLEVCWVWWPNGPRRPKSNPKKWKYESNWYGWRQKRFFVDRDTKQFGGHYSSGAAANIATQTPKSSAVVIYRSIIGL